MATHKLTAAFIKNTKVRKLHGDGAGLYLKVADGKAWVFRFTMNDKARVMGLGGYPAVSLSEARDLAAECRKLKSRGIAHWSIEAEKRRQDAANASAKTFSEVAAE